MSRIYQCEVCDLISHEKIYKVCENCKTTYYCSDECQSKDQEHKSSRSCLTRYVIGLHMYGLFSNKKMIEAISNIATLFAEYNNTEFIKIIIEGNVIYIINNKCSNTSDNPYWKQDKGFNDTLTMLFCREKIIHSETIKINQNYKSYKDKNLTDCDSIDVFISAQKIRLLKMRDGVPDVKNMVDIV